jgi:serine/threonine-protein kinase
MAREAHAAARLGHPALVRVFDFGWTRHGDPYLVMELVQGETLAALLKRESRVPAIRAVQMLLPVIDGLRLAHDKGIVHRDIKPDNVFLAADALGRRQPKLLDFGIAKVDKQQDGRLTQMGAVLGSPDYMSPEQALGLDDIDERTDIWSLCIVLYELITGAIPFLKQNYNALMHAIINEDPTPSVERGAGDKSLWEIIQRGLRKQREERFQSVTELGEAMALWLYEHGIKEDLSGNSIRAVWLDPAMASVPEMPSTRPAIEAANRPTGSRVPTARAPGSVTTGSAITLAPTMLTPARRRLLMFALPAFALLAGLLGAWVVVTMQRAPAAEIEARPAVPPVPKAPTPEPVAAPAAPAPAREEAAPTAAATAKPSSGVAKAKRAPAVRKKGHDFGF